MDIAQDVYNKLQQMPAEKVQTVLAFVNFLQQTDKVKDKAQNKSEDSIAQYAGMIKLPKTGKPRSLLDFNPADIFDDEEINESR